ncbi:unnamed protein product [Coregonus sp. 'balchen']|nr:unnamed protein product [Coregonus sp. 'balchen']
MALPSSSKNIKFLRASNKPTSAHWDPQSKENAAVAEKPKPASSKRWLMAVVRHLTFSGIRVQSPMSPERPLAGESWRLQHLGLGLVNSLQLPPSPVPWTAGGDPRL